MASGTGSSGGAGHVVYPQASKNSRSTHIKNRDAIIHEVVVELVLKVLLEITLGITEDIHSLPKIVTMTTTEVTVPCNIKAPGGTTVATGPT